MESRTSLEWWEHTLCDQNALIVWLKKQYHGEATAAGRIRSFAIEHCTDPAHRRTLDLIASQEAMHAEWVALLLTARGETPEILKKEERYWNKTLPGITGFNSGAAVAAHAEHMRLERIQVIAKHPATPEDIRKVFQRILPEEEFHERAFGRMAGEVALAGAQGNHEQGMAALGLVM